MKVYIDCVSIKNFEGWCGADETKQTIIENDKADAFDNLIEEMYPDGLTDTQLNDILRFEEDWVYEQLGIVETV